MIENHNQEQEDQRLRSLYSLELLDSFPESEFDEITFLASQICQTPIALISLIDKDRQWFKSKIGIEIQSTPRDYAFCAHAILQNDVFIVSDPTENERFSTNPLVIGDPHIRFYAGAPLLAPDGQPLGTVCVIDSVPRNLTENQIRSLKALSAQVTKLLELKSKIEILRVSERKFLFKSTAAENIVEGVVLQDSKGNIIDFNPAALNVLGLTSDQLLGRSSLDPSWKSIREDGSDFPGSEHPAMVCLRTSSKQPTVIMGIHSPPRSIRWLSINSVPMFEDGGVNASHAVTSFSDITDLKNAYAEREMIEGQLAESARLSALGEMSAGVAHEINNPLAIIQGKISVLKIKLQDQQMNLDSIVKDLVTIESTIERIAKIASALKNYSRSGENDPFEEVYIKSIIQESIDLCSGRKTKLKIEIELSCSDHLRIECRPNQIAQILLNLMSNSMDAIEEESIKVIRIIVSENVNDISIHFSDTGKSIDPRIAAKIMNPFFTTKAAGKGTGMGLGISKRLAKLHGGDLVYLENEKQTTFRLVLPKAHPKIQE